MSNSKEIMEKVESGEFFVEARDWYIRKYIYNFIERSYLIILACFMTFLIVLTLIYYSSILPIRKNLPVQVNITDTGEQYTKITYLGNDKKNFNINHVLSKYLAPRFAEAFESYDHRDNFKKLNTNRKMIETLGTDGIKHFYLEKTSIRSKDSIVLKYRHNVIRDIFVNTDSIALVENKNENIDPGLKDYTVTLNFTAREVINRKDVAPDGRTQDIVITNWKAKINVYFEEIYYDFENKEFNDLNFKVYGYESNLLNTQ